jgi:hypothetical protein
MRDDITMEEPTVRRAAERAMIAQQRKAGHDVINRTMGVRRSLIYALLYERAMVEVLDEWRHRASLRCDALDQRMRDGAGGGAVRSG